MPHYNSDEDQNKVRPYRRIIGVAIFLILFASICTMMLESGNKEKYVAPAPQFEVVKVKKTLPFRQVQQQQHDGMVVEKRPSVTIVSSSNANSYPVMPPDPSKPSVK